MSCMPALPVPVRSSACCSHFTSFFCCVFLCSVFVLFFSNQLEHFACYSLPSAAAEPYKVLVVPRKASGWRMAGGSAQITSSVEGESGSKRDQL